MLRCSSPGRSRPSPGGSMTTLLDANVLIWGVWNVIITPHSAGGRPLGADELIVKNVTALASGGNFENKL